MMITSSEVIAAYEATGWTPVAFKLFVGPIENPAGGCALGVVAQQRLGYLRSFPLETFDPDMTGAEWTGIASGFNYGFTGVAIDPVTRVRTDKQTSVVLGADPHAWERGVQIGRDVGAWWDAKCIAQGKQLMTEAFAEAFDAVERELLPA